MNIDPSRKALWGLGLGLILLIPLTGLLGWATLEHMQALAIWMMTGLLLVDRLLKEKPKQSRGKWWFLPLGIFWYGLLSTIVLSGTGVLVFFGQLNQWLGAWTLFCCTVIGLSAIDYITPKVLRIYYWVVVGLGVGSLLYDIPRLLSNDRLSGLVLQPDILAILLGTGLIVRLLIPIKVKHAYIDILSTVLLVMSILLTRTRAVIYLLPIWLVIVIVQHRKQLLASRKKQVLSLMAAFLILITAGAYAAPRVLSLSRAQYGVSYRVDLMKHSSNYLTIMAPWGLGPGGLSGVVADYYPLPPSLEHTVVIDQKIPENSHNIFLDRFLGYGWLTGLAYLVMIVLFAIAALRTRHDEIARVLSVMGVYLLVQQSVTSTNIILEVLTWICLLGVIAKASLGAKKLSGRQRLLASIVILYLAIMGIALQIRADQTNALKRVANNFTFPLLISKTTLQKGTSYNNETLIWDSNALQSYHHHYVAADIHTPEGTPVVAAKAGQVVEVRTYDSCDLRHFPGVTIQGLDGFYYYYAHLKPGSIQVKVGDQLSSGDQFALVGSSACAQNTASHLHLDISRFPLAWRRGFGAQITRIDPQPALIDAYQELSEK